MTDQHLYDSVADELRHKVLTPGLWTRAVAESGGDVDTARALYIRFRVAELKEHEREEFERQKQEAEREAQHRQLVQQRGAEQTRVALEEMRTDIRAGRAATCIACGRECAPRRLDKSYLVLAAGLSLCFVVPGVLYLLFAKGHIFRCEHCGTKLYTQWT